MRKLFFINSLAALFFCSLNCSAQTPKEFSDRIGSSTDSLYLLAAVWGNTFLENYNGEQHYENLTPLRKDLQEFITDQLETFKSIPDVAGSEKLRASLIAFYDYEQKLITKAFIPFEKLTSSSSDNQVNECRSNLKEEAASEKDFLGTVNTERRAYAKLNGFSLVPPPVVKPAPRAVPRPTPPPPPRAQTKPTNAEPVPGPDREPRKSAMPHQPPPKPAKEDSEEEGD